MSEFTFGASAPEDLLLPDKFLFCFIFALRTGAADIQDDVLPRIHSYKVPTLVREVTRWSVQRHAMFYIQARYSSQEHGVKTEMSLTIATSFTSSSYVILIYTCKKIIIRF